MTILLDGWELTHRFRGHIKSSAPRQWSEGARPELVFAVKALCRVHEFRLVEARVGDIRQSMAGVVRHRSVPGKACAELLATG
jgi:hypothetical protein